MKYLLVFYFAGFFLADAGRIKKYKLSLELEEDEFQGTVTLTLNDTNNHEVELDQYIYNVTECTYTGIDFPINPLPDLPETPPPETPTTTTSTTTASTTTASTTTASTTTASTTTASTTTASTTTASTKTTPTTTASTTTTSTTQSLSSQALSSPKKQVCRWEGNKIKFYGNRTGEEVVLKFKGKYKENGLYGYETKSGDRFYVADMTAKDHAIIFPCKEKEKAEFEFEDRGVMSNLENLREKDKEKEIFLRNLTFVQGDIVKDDESLPYYRMKKSEKMGQKLKKVMEKVNKLDRSLKILFTPVEEEIPIIPRDVLILSKFELKSNDSGLDYTELSRKLVDVLFQRPKGEKNNFFDIVGPEFAAMKISGIPDSHLKEYGAFWKIRALGEDGFNNSKSLNELASNIKDSEWNPVFEAKGISVLYSLESICGDGNFTKGLSNYIRNGSSTVNEAFEVCFENKEKAGEFFKLWTDDPGYPVVHVMLSKPAEYNMNQERFLWFGSEQKDRRWIIPINYKANGSEDNTMLPATKNNVTVKINSAYFILDHNNKGFYRVNYDAKLWEALTSQLKSNHSVIDPVSRMKLIDDVFSFPKSIYHFTHGIPDYVTAFKLSEYLKNETDTATLIVAFDALGFLDSALNSSYHGKFRDHMKGILSEIYNKTKDLKDPVLQSLVHLTACKFGVEECMKNATATFDNIKPNTTELSNGERIAICSVVRNNSTKWMDSFALLTAKGIGTSEKNSLLGCSRDENILSLFLAQFITLKDKEGFKKAATFAMDHNPDNIKTMLNIIKRFEGAITKVFGEDFLKEIVRLTFPKLNPESEVTLKEIAKSLDDSFKKDVDSVCENVKLWTNTKAKSVGEYFKGRGKGSGSQAKPIALVLLATTLLPLANHIFHS